MNPAASPANAAERAMAGWGDLLNGSNGLRSAALSGGVALHAINLYVATTLLPSVVREIGGLAFYAWNTTLFVIASILGSALGDGLLQRLGARSAYSGAALLFALGSLLCATAPSMPALLGGRVVQGLGGGLLLALPYALIRQLFDAPLWPRAMALLSSMWGVATLLGPALGGAFAEAGLWRGAFWALLPLSGLFLLLAWRVLPGRNQRPSAVPPLARRQLCLLSAAVLAVSAGSVSANLAWNGTGLALALALLAWLRRIEAHGPLRLLPCGALRLGAPLGLLYATMALLAVTVTCSELFLPWFLQILHDQSPLRAGYLAAIMSAGWSTTALFSAAADDRRADLALRTAPLLTLAGMLLLAVALPYRTSQPAALLALLSLAMALVGFGVGIAWPHLAARVLQAAPVGEQQLASASISTVQLFATAFGAALAGMVANLAGLSVPGGESAAARWLFALFALAPALCLLLDTRPAAPQGKSCQARAPAP